MCCCTQMMSLDLSHPILDQFVYHYWPKSTFLKYIIKFIKNDLQKKAQLSQWTPTKTFLRDCVWTQSLCKAGSCWCTWLCPKALCLYPTFSSVTRQDCKASCGLLSPMLWGPRGPVLQRPQKKVLKTPLLPSWCGTAQLSTAPTVPASAGTSSATSFNLSSAAFTPLFLQMGLGWPA